jgi:hypothetical protein
MEEKKLYYKKQVEIAAVIDFPVITFVAEKVRISTGDTSWFEMGYVPRFNGLTKKEFQKETEMYYDDIDKMLEKYVRETYNALHGWGRVGSFTYSGKQLGLPDLPEIEPNYNDDHADLVKMFSGGK